MKVSVLIPCYNEEDNIIECINRVELPYKYEIVVIDDGSKDKTKEKANSVKKNNLRVIGYKKNQGKGNAIRFGVENATGDIIVIQDADMTSPPEELSDVLNPILEDKADFVNGTRFYYPMEKNAMNKMRFFGNRIFAIIISLVLRVRLSDTLCGFKAFNINKFKYLDLNETSWPDFELLFQAKKSGMKIVEVPIHYKERKYGKTKMKEFKHGLIFTKMLIKNIIDFYLE